MAEPLIAGLPPGLELVGGFAVRVAALDAATGADVAGVLISNVVITAADVSGHGEDDRLKDVEPLFTPVPANLFAPEPASG